MSAENSYLMFYAVLAALGFVVAGFILYRERHPRRQKPQDTSTNSR
jgi:hypothetical protein